MKSLSKNEMKQVKGGVTDCFGQCSFSGPGYSVPYEHAFYYPTRAEFMAAVCGSSASNDNGFTLNPQCEMWNSNPPGGLQ